MLPPDSANEDSHPSEPFLVDDLAQQSGELGIESLESGEFERAQAENSQVSAAAASTSPATRSRGKWGMMLVAAVGVWALGIGLRFARDQPGGPALVVEKERPSASANPADEPGKKPAGDRLAEKDPPTKPDAVPEEEPSGADPEAQPWLSPEIHHPDSVTYTLRFGGTLENVANLFKIYHHEIKALNPGIDLKKPLPPKSKVVIFRHKDAPSESVGYPDDGSLVGAVPMMEGAGRQLLAVGWKRWATAHTVSVLDQVLDRWAKRPQTTQPILVGNMSARNGGKLPPHGSHRSGRDVDLGYIQKAGIYEELNWREINAQNLDSAETWELIELLLGTGKVEVIFIDRAIQKVLYDFAVASKRYSKAQLTRLMEYPGPVGQGKPKITHVKGHVDHLHVRFKCGPGEKRCRSRP